MIPKDKSCLCWDQLQTFGTSAWPFAVTSEKLQPKLNTKLVLLTKHLYVQYVGTNWTPHLLLFLYPDGTPLSFVQLHTRSQVLSGPIFGTWSLWGNKRRTACHLDSVYTPKKEKYIYSASISDFFALYPSIYLSSNYFSDVILKHIVPYRAITHDAFCNYLRRHSYLYVILYIIYNMRILE